MVTQYPCSWAPRSACKHERDPKQKPGRGRGAGGGKRDPTGGGLGSERSVRPQRRQGPRVPENGGRQGQRDPATRAQARGDRARAPATAPARLHVRIVAGRTRPRPGPELRGAERDQNQREDGRASGV